MVSVSPSVLLSRFHSPSYCYACNGSFLDILPIITIVGAEMIEVEMCIVEFWFRKLRSRKGCSYQRSSKKWKYNLKIIASVIWGNTKYLKTHFPSSSIFPFHIIRKQRFYLSLHCQAYLIHSHCTGIFSPSLVHILSYFFQMQKWDKIRQISLSLRIFYILVFLYVS